MFWRFTVQSLSLLGVGVLTLDTFRSPRRRLGSIGIVSFPSLNTIPPSFSSTEVKVLSKSKMGLFWWVTVSFELAGILPRTFPKNMDVETVDLSTLTPEIRVQPPPYQANKKGRVEEMQWIVDNVNKQKTYRATCKHNASDAELATMLERRRQTYQEKYSQSTSKDPLANCRRWRY